MPNHQNENGFWWIKFNNEEILQQLKYSISLHHKDTEWKNMFEQISNDFYQAKN